MPESRLPAVLPELLAPEVLLASLFVIPAGMEYPDFPVPGVNVYLVEEGEMRVHAERGRTLTGTAGDLITLTAGRHGFSAGTKQPLILYQVHFFAGKGPWRSGVPSLPGTGPMPRRARLGASAPACAKQFQTLMRTLHEHGPAWELGAAACVLEMVRMAFVAAAREDGKSPAPLSRWDMLLARLDADTDMDIRGMAEFMHCAPEHFIREFRRRYGNSPRQYLLLRSLERARRLVRDGASIKTAAAGAGFRSALQFNRTHRKYYGEPPSAGCEDANGVASERPAGLPVSRHIWAPGVAYASLEAWCRNISPSP